MYLETQFGLLLHRARRIMTKLYYCSLCPQASQFTVVHAMVVQQAERWPLPLGTCQPFNSYECIRILYLVFTNAYSIQNIQQLGKTIFNLQLFYSTI